MANFDFNGGNITDVSLGNSNLKVFASVQVKVENAAIKIAGHTVINLNGDLSFEDVQFEKHALLPGNKLNGKKMLLIVDVSKFKVEETELMEGDTKVTCTFTLFTKNGTVKEFKLDDAENPEPNSVFNYLLSFSK